MFLSRAIRVAVLMFVATVLSAQSEREVLHFHAMIPLGAEAYEVRSDKWKDLMTLLASAENPRFEGMVSRPVNQHDELFSPDGTRVETYPGPVAFRITATWRARFMEASPFPIGATGDANDYLLHLKFRVVVFHGLRQKLLEPDSVEMIGVPGEEPYDERIYRLVVDLTNVPLSDRVVV